MNASVPVPRSPSERSDAALRKSVLFCPDCGRTAPVGDWPVRITDVETVVCPDCHASLAVTRIGRTSAPAEPVMNIT